MSEIKFKTKLYKINNWTILWLPEDASAQLPSRGMTMVSGTLNNIPFKAVLEPDGRYLNDRKPSHWFKPHQELLHQAKARAGDTVVVTLEPTKEWIEPEIPEDVQKTLESSPKANELWNDITPIARWDWVRWIRAVKTQETREKHLKVMLDKLNKGMRRPCCFNRSMCSEPTVCPNYKLIDPN